VKTEFANSIYPGPISTSVKAECTVSGGYAKTPISCFLVFFSQIGQENGEQRLRSCVATCSDLFVELHAIATSLLPSLQKVGFVGIKNTGFFGRWSSFWKDLCLYVVGNGLATESQLSRDFTFVEALLMECSHSFIAGMPIVSANLFVERTVAHPTWTFTRRGGHGAVVLFLLWTFQPL